MSRDRDRILEQALKHELRAADMAVTDACLDAETLGAWADDGLDGAAMVAAEAHISTCARCQALVGALMKSDPPGTLSTLGTPGTLGTSGTFSLWRWWLAPIAAGAAAVTLWMVVPEQQQVAVAPPPIAAEADRAPVAAAEPPPSPSAPPSTAARERQSPRDSLAAGAREDRQQLRDEAKQEKALADAAVTPRENAAAVAPAPLAEAPAAAAPRAAAQEAGAAQMRQSFAPLEIPTLDRSRRWRIVNNNRIERTDDDGATWRLMGEVDDQSISAGSAPSNSVAWFVGSSGLVLLTTDAGGTLRTVNLVEPLDIASVSATDAQSAIVSTVSGRRFRTDDGGRTWRPF